MSDIPEFSPECRCGAGTPVSCPPGHYMYSWVGRGIVEEALAGKQLVYDARTTKCLQEALAYARATAPEVMIWRGLPEVYVELSKEWDDPEKRSALLKRMAASRDIREFFSPHLSIHDNVRLWVARFKAYIDVIEQIALNNVIPDVSHGATNLFYERF